MARQVPADTFETMGRPAGGRQ